MRSVSLASVEIRDFRLYYDQGMNVSIRRIAIKDSDTKSVLPDGKTMLSIANRVLRYLSLMHRIEIDTLEVKGEKIKIHYRNEEIFVWGRDAYVHLRPVLLAEGLLIEVPLIDYAPQKLTGHAKFLVNLLNMNLDGAIRIDSPVATGDLVITGDMSQIKLQLHKTLLTHEKLTATLWADGRYDLTNNTWMVEGKVDTMNVMSDFAVLSDNSDMDVVLYNTSIPALDTLVNAIPLSDTIKTWLVDRVRAKHYQLDYVYLPLSLKPFRIRFEEMMAQGYLSLPHVTFNEKLNPMDAAEVTLKLQHGDLVFHSVDGEYDGLPADVNVTLASLFKGPSLQVHVLSSALLDGPIHEILNAYNIPLESVRQTQGDNLTHFFLDLDFSGKKPLVTDVLSRIENGTFLAGGAPLHSKGGTVHVDGAKAIEMTDFNVQFSTLVDLNLTGTIDLKQKELRSNILINSLNAGDDIISMKSVTTPLELSFADGVSVALPEFRTAARFNKGRLDIHVDDVRHFTPYSPLLKLLDIRDGNASVVHEDGKTELDANIRSQHPSFLQKGKGIEEYRVHYAKSGTIQEARLNDFAQVFLDPENLYVTCQDLDINISRLLERYDSNTSKNVTKKAKATYEPEAEERKPMDIHVYGRDMGFLYGERRVPAESLSLFMSGEQLDASLDYGKTHITLNKDYDHVVLKGRRINSAFTKQLLKFEMEDGKANFLISGDLKRREFYGVVNLKDTTIKGFTLINNIIAFINTVPSLVTFQNPGYDAKGYTIRKGTIEFFVSGDMIYLSTIRMIGDNTDIIGYGQLDLKTKKIHLTFVLSTIKGFSNLLSKIPLIGYALLGDDKSIGTTIRVGGTLDDPKVDTNLASDAAFYPFSVVKRTLMWPLKLFDDEHEKEE